MRAVTKRQSARVGQTEKTTPSVRELKQERSSSTRQRLVSSALDLICELGFNDFSTQSVAERAGVSRGALQYHFRSREDLLMAVRKSVGELVPVNLLPGELRKLPLKTRVSRFVDQYWSVVGSRNYIASIEIRLFERINLDLHRIRMQELTQVTKDRDAAWLQSFPESPASRAKKVMTRRFMLDTLHGLALRKLEEGGASQLALELDLLKTTLVGALTSP